MKRKKFRTMLLLAAIIVFFALGRNMWASIILMLVSLYVIIEVLADIWKEVHHANR